MVSVCRQWAELPSAPLDITWKGEGSLGKANDSQVGVSIFAIKSFRGWLIPSARLLLRNITVCVIIPLTCKVWKCTVLIFEPCGLIECGSMEVRRAGRHTLEERHLKTGNAQQTWGVWKWENDDACTGNADDNVAHLCLCYRCLWGDICREFCSSCIWQVRATLFPQYDNIWNVSVTPVTAANCAS